MTTRIKSILSVLLLSFMATGAFAGKPAPRYLAFQIFTGGLESPELRKAFPPPPGDLGRTVTDLRDRIGSAGNADRRLAFVIGPISFEETDDEVRATIRQGFDIALQTGVAVGFHLDDQMFWGRLKELNTPDNLEWLDWNCTLNTGRRLDWSSKPVKILPQLCLNSTAVREAVSARAAIIGEEVAKGTRKLEAANRGDLFLGVIAGWETRIGQDFDTGKNLGCHALANAGFSAQNSPGELDAARIKIIREFTGFWAGSLIKAGVPGGKVYSHFAFMSETMYQLASRANPAAASRPYLQTINFTPPAAAFCDGCVPGISTYPEPGQLEQWRDELKKHGDPAWASCEGTAIDPGAAGRGGAGMDMECYLGNLFNHGAVLVNIFGWDVGGENNPFRKLAESDNALAAYRKFLRGSSLAEAPIPVPNIPPAGLQDKIHDVQAKLPGWIDKHGPERVRDYVQSLGKALKEKRFDDADRAADAILKIMQE